MAVRFCPACSAAHDEDLDPKGNIEKIAGINMYVALPPDGRYDNEKALLYLPDTHGSSCVHNKLSADRYASSGFQVYMPDLFDNDANMNPVKTDDEATWALEAVMCELKWRGIHEFGATGYCIGGKCVVNLAQENMVSVAVVTCPSFLEIPGDLDYLRRHSMVPVLFNSCRDDPKFPYSIVQDGGYAEYKHVHWDRCAHGFAVRGDTRNPVVKAGNEGAFAEAVAWIKQYL